MTDDKKMRLKFLFFPIMLIVSLAIFIIFIWPEIDNIRNINEKKTTNLQLLQAAKNKQSAIEQLGTQIAKDTDGKTIVNDYLPDKKVEERIISGINYFATDAGVSLTNISLEGSGSAVTSPNASGITGSPVAIVDPLTGLAMEDPNGLKFSKIAISIAGDYSRIRLFIDELQRMTLLNHIRSLVISISSNNDASGENANATNIMANIVADFGYLKVSNLDNNKMAQFKSEVDNETLTTLKQYISQKASSATLLTNYSGNKGKINPFLP